MASSLDIQIVLTEQNVVANWIRNSLIATLVALAIFGLIAIDKVQKQYKYISYLKILGILFVSIAIWMLWSVTLISQQFYDNFDASPFSTLIKNARNIALALIVVLFALILLFVFI